jgi:hypothetical protein
LLFCLFPTHGVMLAESEAQNTLFLFLTTTATDMFCII